MRQNLTFQTRVLTFSVLGLVVAVLIPPYLPSVQTIEQLITLFFWNGLVWAFANLGIFIAWKTRGPENMARIAAAEAKFAGIRYSDPSGFAARVVSPFLVVDPADIIAT